MGIGALTGRSAIIGPYIGGGLPSMTNNTGLIDATGEKYAMIGQFWHPSRSSKDISRVQFRFGTVTKSGGSGLTVSLQNVDMSPSTGPPKPDGTQDETVAIANGDSNFASNTWYRTGTLSANRTIQIGEYIAVVVEFDGSGRQGSDAINFSIVNGFPNFASLHFGGGWLHYTSSWGSEVAGRPNLILECSDGSFGTITSSFPATGFNGHTISSSSELGLKWTPPYPAAVEGIIGYANASNCGELDYLIYDSSGTELLAKNFKPATWGTGTGFNRSFVLQHAPVELSAGATYRFALRPATTTSVMFYSFDLNAASHRAVHDFGEDACFTSRADAGSWTDTTTRLPCFGLLVSGISSGGGGGSPPSSVGIG